jgi:hypothetical protein
VNPSIRLSATGALLVHEQQVSGVHLQCVHFNRYRLLFCHRLNRTRLPFPAPRESPTRFSQSFHPLSPHHRSLNFAHLRALANSAISVWSSAQTRGLQLIVSSSLDVAQRNEWRSLVFDPPSTDDVVSSTYPRIFTLFPRVTALKMPVPAEAPASLPGSWPEKNQEPHMIETRIHPGTGLPEWSVLVLRGKEEPGMEEAMYRGRVACRFMQDRHAGRYLGSKRVTILVSAKQPRTSHNSDVIPIT